MGSYYYLTISQLLSEDEDLVVSICFENGAQGVSEELDFKQTPENYDPETIEASVKKIVVYFLEPPALNFVENLKSKYPDLVVELQSAKNMDWMNEWKKNFKPFHLSGPFWVVPSWEPRPSEAEIELKIDPGMAFGTGTHETTQLVSELICSSESIENQSVLDVGTGTGILAFVAAHLGGRVLGNDVDLEALRVARENLEINLLTERVSFVDTDLQDIKGEFSVVMANIIDGVLLKIAIPLKERVAPQGRLFLSGILEERYELFVSQFLKNDFKIKNKLQKGEWIALELVKI